MDELSFTLQELHITNPLTNYKEKIKSLIINKINSPCAKYIHESTILGDNSIENIKKLEIAFNIRQKQMKEGDIAQIIIGNFIGWEDLGIGHPSGLDCRKLDNSIIIEVKNKYNTCNSNSQKTVLDKLVKYKKENLNTRCILGIINPKAGHKQSSEIIMHDEIAIEKIYGMELFKIIFTIDGIDYSQEIINFTKEIMYSS